MDWIGGDGASISKRRNANSISPRFFGPWPGQEARKSMISSAASCLLPARQYRGALEILARLSEYFPDEVRGMMADVKERQMFP